MLNSVKQNVDHKNLLKKKSWILN